MSITLSDEQFKHLLDRLQISGSSSGNFTKCSSRFSGSKVSDVNAFIDAVEIYKDCTHVSDENALRGLPMLLDDFAARWWHGVKSTITTWDAAVDLLKRTYGPVKPPYRVYRELFASEQDLITPTDIFICKARGILSQLPANTLSESIQLDMVYGLLNRRMKEKIPRNKVETFTELLEKSRLAEEIFNETIYFEQNKTNTKKLRCTYCRTVGHSKGECDKLSTRPIVDTVPSTIESPVEFCMLNTDIKSNSIALRPRPIMYINILGLQGTGIIDTAAKESIAGQSLYNVMVAKGQTFKQDKIYVGLADGSTKLENVLITYVDVKIQGRVIPTRFIILTDAVNNSTLLGINFIQDARISVDVSNRMWSFSDAPFVKYELHFETNQANEDTKVYYSDFLRSDEGSMLPSTVKEKFNAQLTENRPFFPFVAEPTPYGVYYKNTEDIGSAMLDDRNVQRKPNKVSRRYTKKKRN
ncbi:uncharacterized protein LOC108903332 [Anoplophora glabripennis]|uniref:uncharacterized protein LOC108903332 n=1 Tax=Anoplophora glabripennis TaxID=217634 RepID=UPI0008755051|nr:uncharacterized protein LOC108903332 [Anoplophora glabripennis]